MGMFISVSANSILSQGKFRFYFRNVQDFTKISKLSLPFRITVEGQTVDITRMETDLKARTMMIEIDNKADRTPVFAMGTALVAVAGTSIFNMTFDRIEKEVDNPGISWALVIVGILVAVFLIHKLSKK